MPVPLDHLPRYNGWPARFLGPVDFAQRIKSEPEILREYNVEKWGAMLREIQQETPTPTIEALEARIAQDQASTVCSIEDHLELLDAATSQRMYIDLIAATLADFLPAAAIVELGCGYGRVLLSIARRFPGIRIIGGEFTESGEKLTRLLAGASGIEATIGHCDFNRSPVADFDIPEGAVIYTAYATTYAAQFGPVLERLRAVKPAAVIHFEPCYEHFDSDSLLGLLRQKYVIANDYNRDMISALKAAESRGDITVSRELRNVLGPNPLLPASVVCWRPATRKQ